MRLLFCNIGWMERYQGLHTGDQITGGGAYVKEKGMGHEICNYSPTNNTLYGYVQPPGDKINIERIGAKSEDVSIGGVTVVWTANRPGFWTVIVGWYKDATVFRNYQKFTKVPSSQSKNGIDGYWIKAQASKATLLPVDERVFKVPRQVKGGMGQSNIWYADKAESAQTVKSVADFINGVRTPPVLKGKHGNKKDQERKAKVERVAIRSCCSYFENLGYEVVSVEKDNLGWDLQATIGRSSLRIEVKGLSGAAFSVELTPNEYQTFLQKDNDYRLAVVLNALEIETAELFICRYSKEQGVWLIEGREGSSLSIQVKESASIKCIKHVDHPDQQQRVAHDLEV